MDHGSTMLTQATGAMATSGRLLWALSGRLTGVGIEHNSRALITCMALGNRAHRPSPHHPTSFRYYYYIVKSVSFCFAILVRPRVTFLCIALRALNNCGKITPFHAYKKGTDLGSVHTHTRTHARTHALTGTPSSRSHSVLRTTVGDSGHGYHLAAWGTPLAMPLHPSPLWVSPGGSPGTPHRQTGCGSWCPRDDQP